MTSTEPARSYLKFRFARIPQLATRLVMRVFAFPFQGLPEGHVKIAARRFILRFQNSIPTELAVNRGDVVVQIGTPRAKTMRRFRRLIGASGRLIIVEAMPENQEHLARAIVLAGYTNVDLVRAAACNEEKMGELAISPFPGDHKIPLQDIRMDNDLRPENHEMRLIPVRFVRLDDELARLNVQRINFLSVTVNGAEAEVIKGARNILMNSPAPVRVFAKGHALDAAGRPIHEATRSLLRELGFVTVITHGEPSSSGDRTWRRRAGDLFAWKEN